MVIEQFTASTDFSSKQKCSILFTLHSILFITNRNRALSRPKAVSSTHLLFDKLYLKTPLLVQPIAFSNGFFRFGIKGNAESHSMMGGTWVPSISMSGHQKPSLSTVSKKFERPYTWASWYLPRLPTFMYRKRCLVSRALPAALC